MTCLEPTDAAAYGVTMRSHRASALGAVLLGAVTLVATALLPLAADGAAPGPGPVGRAATVVDVSDPQHLPGGHAPRAAYLDFTSSHSPIYRPGMAPLGVGPGSPRHLMRVRGGYLVIVDSAKVLFVADNGKRRLLDRAATADRSASDAVASRNGRLVAVSVGGSNDRHERISVRRISDGRLLAQRRFEDPVRVLSFSRDRALLTSKSSCGPCGPKVVTRWWNLRDNRLRTIDAAPRPAVSYGITPSGDLSSAQVALVRDQHERVVGLRHRPGGAWHTPDGEWVLSWSPDDRYVLTVSGWSEGGWDSLTVRRADTGAAVTRLDGNSNLYVDGLDSPAWESASTIVFEAGYDCSDGGCDRSTDVRCTVAGRCHQVALPAGVDTVRERRLPPT